MRRDAGHVPALLRRVLRRRGGEEERHDGVADGAAAVRHRAGARRPRHLSIFGDFSGHADARHQDGEHA